MHGRFMKEAVNLTSQVLNEVSQRQVKEYAYDLYGLGKEHTTKYLDQCYV